MVDRHQSNDVEILIKQFIHHLRTYVSDSSLKYRWSEDTITLTYRICTQQQIDFWDWWLHAFPTYLRFSRPQLFKLSVDILTGANSKEIIRRLDKDLQTILHLSFEAQKLFLVQHKSDDAPLPIMLVGDFISVKPCDHFTSQLSPTWTGLSRWFVKPRMISPTNMSIWSPLQSYTQRGLNLSSVPTIKPCISCTVIL